MKVNLPKLQNIGDVRKYLMVIESLELNKLNNAISVNAKLDQQVKSIEDLKSMKLYYGDLAEFLIKRQSEFRLDQFETVFIQQIEEFLQFWQQIMEEFRELSDSEIEKAIQKNEDLKQELQDLLEKTLGFRAPPDSLFLNLLSIRKIAAKSTDTRYWASLPLELMKPKTLYFSTSSWRTKRSGSLLRLAKFKVVRLSIQAERTRAKTETKM